jgi:hypothetical protein
MTDAQEQDLKEIKFTFTNAVDKKYRTGQKEHGGNLWDRDPVPEMEAEIVDLFTYYKTLRDRENKVRLILYNANAGNVKCDEAINQLSEIYKMQ